MSVTRRLMIERFVLSDIAISTELRIERLLGENWELTMFLSCVVTSHETGPDTAGTVCLKTN